MSYERNGSPESSRWKTNADEFRGYVRAKLEDLNTTQEAQWEEHRATKKRIKWLETKAQYTMGGLALLNAIFILIVAVHQMGLLPL